MKKLPLLKQLLAVLCCMIYLQNQSFAQEKKRKVLFGVYGGANLSKITPPEKPSNFMPFGKSYKRSVSYNFGAYVNAYIAKKIYLEAGINVLSRVSNTSFRRFSSTNFTTYIDGVKDYNLLHDIKYNHELIDIQIPLSLHVDIIQRPKWKVNIYGGVFWENEVKHNVNIESIKYWDTPPTQRVLDDAAVYFKQRYSYPIIEKYTSNDYTFDKSNVGGVIGAGISYKKVGLDINYNASEKIYRGYGIYHYKIPSIVFNLRYTIN
ncbi:outer membrane beta-barrel protein [Emticicia soli]|uniref:Outer membrane beta-barrel protein n=1 Tax=Emticicia soli TaxID=2027878 RepID=A0ABW5JBH7_9BACT